MQQSVQQCIGPRQASEPHSFQRGQLLLLSPLLVQLKFRAVHSTRGCNCILMDMHVSAWTSMCPRGPACVRVDTWVSIVMELIECSDDVHTMQRSAHVRNIPHTQIEHVSICAEFFCKVSTTLRCSMQDSAGVMHGVLCIHADMHVRTYPHHSALLRTSLSINGPLLRPSQHCIVSSVI